MIRRSMFVWSCLLAFVSTARGADELQFNRDVRPILSDHCFACHGFDAKARQGDLRLDDAADATRNRDGQFAVKPGDLAGSQLWARITSTDEQTVMPPPSTKKTLTAAQKEILKRWIEQGAPYQKHWAFEAPVKPAEPAVRRADWVRRPIDKFLLARLEREGLEPQPEASRETLIRRVAFALTGLPPRPAEVDAYLADSGPNAYENMVDRYLRSPHYGEEMARHWLDVARYADTHGLHLDNERSMWAYRDWVVRAFNQNLPFDQFTVWQLAGDQLPEPTVDQLTATGFNRCNVTTSEGGSIGEEFLYRYAVERTSTTIQAWMGLTGGCAVCHDHKYDPLSTKEFYSLYSFFYSAADPAMDGNTSLTAPVIKVPKPGQAERLAAAEAAERTALAELEAYVGTLDYRDPSEAPSDPAKRVETEIELFDDLFPTGLNVRNTSRNPSRWADRPAFGVPSGRRALYQANGRFHEESIQSFPAALAIPADGRFAVHVRLDPLEPPRAIGVAIGAGGVRRLVWGDPAAFENLNPADAIVRGPLPPLGQWTRLEVPLAELKIAEGTELQSLALQISGGVAWWDRPTLAGRIDPATDPSTGFLAWRKAWTGKSAGGLPSDLAGLLKEGPEKTVDPAAIARLRAHYLARVARPDRPEWEAKRRAWTDAAVERAAADEAIETTFVFKDLPQPRDAFVMLRGQYDRPGEKVAAGVPAVFPPLRAADAARPVRLDLARWLVAPDHPLTARVAVNRIWQQLFGVGLVKTSGDFGSQGEPPSHPELLDWLAVRFQESGWDVRELVRMLVESAAFRQQARLTPDAAARDPENRWLSRGPRFRLDAEQIRDNALFVSGLIRLEMGGRGVRTYQPSNIWEPVGYSDSNTRYYLQDHGEALYRRSLYCFLKRTAPPPFMSNFDGPNREQSCSRRERSNTPLQALQLMNDVQHFEAARALAERTIEAGGSTDDRLRRLYRTVLARTPEDDELRLLRDALGRQHRLFAADPEAAEKALRTGESPVKRVAPAPELAAWTLLANLVLNLDETVNRN